MGAKIDYIYILGASHSGSTLLAMLLNAHPEITTIGETSPGRLGDCDTYRCSCGTLIRECAFWNNVTQRMRQRHPDFSVDNFGTKFELAESPFINRVLNMEHRGTLFELARDTVLRCSRRWQRRWTEITARCYDLASAVLAESSGRVLVDSSKIAHRLKFLLQARDFNIKVIHLVRDGRAVALTYMRQDEFADSREPALRRGGRGMEAEAPGASLPMKKAANEWLRCLKSAEHLLAGLDKSRWIQVRYEELCSETGETLARLFAFLGLGPKEYERDFRAVENHVIGNGMRLDSTSEVVLDERWKSVLTEEELRVFEREAGWMNRRYGYK